jgi:hypothetical protein
MWLPRNEIIIKDCIIFILNNDTEFSESKIIDINPIDYKDKFSIINIFSKDDINFIFLILCCGAIFRELIRSSKFSFTNEQINEFSKELYKLCYTFSTNNIIKIIELINKYETTYGAKFLQSKDRLPYELLIKEYIDYLIKILFYFDLDLKKDIEPNNYFPIINRKYIDNEDIIEKKINIFPIGSHFYDEKINDLYLLNINKHKDDIKEIDKNYYKMIRRLIQLDEKFRKVLLRTLLILGAFFREIVKSNLSKEELNAFSENIKYKLCIINEKSIENLFIIIYNFLNNNDNLKIYFRNSSIFNDPNFMIEYRNIQLDRLVLSRNQLHRNIDEKINAYLNLFEKYLFRGYNIIENNNIKFNFGKIFGGNFYNLIIPIIIIIIIIFIMIFIFKNIICKLKYLYTYKNDFI